MSKPSRRRQNRRIRAYVKTFEACKVATTLVDGGWTPDHIFTIKPEFYPQFIRDLRHLATCEDLEILVRYKGNLVRKEYAHEASQA